MASILRQWGPTNITQREEKLISPEQVNNAYSHEHFESGHLTSSYGSPNNAAVVLSYPQILCHVYAESLKVVTGLQHSIVDTKLHTSKYVTDFTLRMSCLDVCKHTPEYELRSLER